MSSGGLQGVVVQELKKASISEWLVIAEEPATISGLYLNYILVLAAIPAVCGFIKMSFLGIR